MSTIDQALAALATMTAADLRRKLLELERQHSAVHAMLRAAAARERTEQRQRHAKTDRRNKGEAAAR